MAQSWRDRSRFNLCLADSIRRKVLCSEGSLSNAGGSTGMDREMAYISRRHKGKNSNNTSDYRWLENEFLNYRLRKDERPGQETIPNEPSRGQRRVCHLHAREDTPVTIASLVTAVCKLQPSTVR